MVRALTIHDLKCLEASFQFPLPDINRPQYFYQIAVEDEEGLVGIAILKLTSETILVLDKDVSRLRKTKALLEIWEPIEREHERNNLEDTHVFLLNSNEAENKSFSKLLQKLGFKAIKGISLFYRARSSQWLKKIRATREIRRIVSREAQQPRPKRTSTEDQTQPLVPVD